MVGGLIFVRVPIKIIMKKVLILLSVASTQMIWQSCADNNRYIDLTNGKTVTLEKDKQTGLMVDADTKKPVTLYVDTKTKDTIYGKTGKVINGHVIRSGNSYAFDEDVAAQVPEGESYKVKDGNYKMKVQKDGDIKIRDGDKKVKIDAETGERKVKKN